MRYSSWLYPIRFSHSFSYFSENVEMLKVLLQQFFSCTEWMNSFNLREGSIIGFRLSSALIKLCFFRDLKTKLWDRDKLPRSRVYFGSHFSQFTISCELAEFLETFDESPSDLYYFYHLVVLSESIYHISYLFPCSHIVTYLHF